MGRHLASLGAAALLAACTQTVRVAGPPPPQARGQSGTMHTLGIPPGHLPRAGQCRVWIPGRPPGQQARARSCSGITTTAPAGSWILYRPDSDRSHVHVRVVDDQRASIVLKVQVFVAQTGVFVSEREPTDQERDESDGQPGRGRGRRP